jgi:hypothetical protein
MSTTMRSALNVTECTDTASQYEGELQDEDDAPAHGGRNRLLQKLKQLAEFEFRQAAGFRDGKNPELFEKDLNITDTLPLPEQQTYVKLIPQKSEEATKQHHGIKKIPDLINNDPSLADADPDVDVPDPRTSYAQYHHVTNNRTFVNQLFLNMHAHVATDFMST